MIVAGIVPLYALKLRLSDLLTIPEPRRPPAAQAQADPK
jgi:hypothetical protein